MISWPAISAVVLLTTTPSRTPSRRRIKIDDPRQIEHSRTGPVGRSDQLAGGMRRIDDIHALAVFDLLARHADFLEDFMGRGTDRRLIHEIAAVPEPAAEREALLDDHGAEAHVGQDHGRK